MKKVRFKIEDLRLKILTYNFYKYFVSTIVIGVLFCLPISVKAEESASSTPEIPDTTVPIPDDGESASSTPETIDPPTPTSTPEIPDPEVPDEAPTSTPTPQTESQIAVNFNLRYQDSLIFSNQVIIPTSTSIADNEGFIHFTTSSNVLTALLAVDSNDRSFEVTDLAYYESYKSFYLNCIEINTPTTTPLCGNWNYVVDGNYPSVGMDAYELSGDETVYLYFSNPWKITASTSTFPINTTTTLETWHYQYDSLEEEWAHDGNDMIDISIPNPNPTGWWDTTLNVDTITTDEEGFADYSFSSTGTYFAKITSLDWTKFSDAITLEVFDTPTTTPTSTPEDDGDQNDDPSGNGGGGGGCGSCGNSPVQNQTVSNAQINEAVQKILNYLRLQQDEEGKIIDGGISDWAIMSFGSNGEYAEDIKNREVSLLNFAQEYNFTDASELNLCASYPRHVLALLSAGVGSSNEQIQNLISKIKTECYAENLYGQNGINDDIFALFALLASGESGDEIVVQDIISAIKQDQTEDGAFTWASWPGADITGAAINALNYAKEKNIEIEQSILDNAKNYLKNEQLFDGGWGFGTSDVLTTSWALMGINCLGESQNNWFNSQGKSPWNVLVDNLTSEGYYESSWAAGTVDWFATKHAVPALLGKQWPIILEPRAPVEDNDNTNNSPSIGGSYNPPTSTSTIDFVTSTEEIITTTTIDIATSTLDIATSTLENNDEFVQDVVDVENDEVVEVVQDDKNVENARELPEVQANVSDNTKQVLGEKIVASQDSVEELNNDQEETVENEDTIDSTDEDSGLSKDRARIIFKWALILTVIIGLYLIWRFKKTVV